MHIRRGQPEAHRQSRGKFNSRLRRLLVTTILTCALVTATAQVSTADAESDIRRKQESLNGKVVGAQKNYNQSTKKLETAAAALQSAEARLKSARIRLNGTRAQLAVARARDVQMQTELKNAEAALRTSIGSLEAGEKTLSRSELRVQEFTLETLREGDGGLRAFGELLRGASPVSFSQRMSLDSAVGDAQLAVMQRLEASKVMLTLKRDQVRSLRNQVADSRRQAALNLDLKESLESNAGEQASKVGDLVDVREGAKSAARATVAADAAQLREFEVERNRLSSRLRVLAAKELAKNHQPKAGSSGGRAPSRSATLYRPVSGPVTSPYGMRVHPVTGVYKLHDGADLAAGCGTPIKAAASGTVIERYYNGAYGNRLIVNHGVLRGANVVTTYNHATGYIVGVGQRVQRGQTIGYVGSTGYSTGCHLHFMAIINGSTMNPMGWV